MPLDLRALLDPVQSHAAASGFFDRVFGHEPKAAPGNGLTCAAWVDAVGPAAGASGLASTTGLVTLNTRLYSSMIADPPDAIDPNLTDALSGLFAAYSGDFTLGAAVRNVDLLGEFGSFPLRICSRSRSASWTYSGVGPSGSSMTRPYVTRDNVDSPWQAMDGYGLPGVASLGIGWAGSCNPERDRSARGMCDPASFRVGQPAGPHFPASERRGRRLVGCPVTDMLAVVVLIDGTGHRPRPPEWWPEPTTRCGVPLGPCSTLTFYGHCAVEDMPLCRQCWPVGAPST